MAAFTHLSFSASSLRNLLANEDLIDESFAEHRFEYILDYLQRIGAKTILAEQNYIDKNYFIDYQNFYSRCFHPYSRKCKRLHFFSLDFDEKDFTNLLHKKDTELSPEDLRKEYLGYMVVRPLPVSVIGTTALKADENGAEEIPCTRTYTSNLFGIPLRIPRGLAYQEQDEVTAACASCSLWFAFQKTSELFSGSYSPSPSEITQFALEKKYGRRAISNKGLSIDQMIESIRKVNLSPHLRNVAQLENRDNFCRIIYSFLKADIPVILVVWVKHKDIWSRHAITVTGYELKNGHQLPSGLTKIKFLGDRVKNLIAHDDQLGPYCTIEVRDISTDPTGNKSVLLREPRGWGDMHAELFLIPLYHKIRITFLDVRLWLTRIDKLFRNVLKYYKDKGVIDISSVEWNTYLTTVEEYKTQAFGYPDSEYITHNMLLSELPKYLWVCEAGSDGEKIFELVIDATDSKRAFFILKAVFFDTKIKNIFQNVLSSDSIRSHWEPALTNKFYDLLLKEAYM